MEFVHDLVPNFRTLDLPLPFFLKVLLDSIDDLLNNVHTDRSLFTGLFQAIEDFDAIVERIATDFEKMRETPEKRRQLIDDLDLTMILIADIEKKVISLQCQIKGGVIETPSPRGWAL